MHRALESLVSALETTPGVAACALEVLSEEERRRVVYEWNDTREEYGSDQCMHELFEEQVEKTPEGREVVFEEACLTYGELNRRANPLGHDQGRLEVMPQKPG